jgi:hypothetical protein
MSVRALLAAVVVVVGTVFVVGCAQTSSSPTSPSSSASSSVSSGTLAERTLTGTSHVTSITHAGSSVVHDPRGDSLSPLPYLDIVQAKVTEQEGKETLFFMRELAGPIPEAPSGLPIWGFHLDTNPATFPGGLYNEYVVRVRWNGGAFVGEVVNTIPLLTGGAPIITPVPFSIDGTTVKVFVPLQTLGNPSSFGWNAATRPAPTPPPPAGYVDFAPDSGLVTWTQ